MIFFQEEILSSKSSMDYDALVSEMGDYSVDSSMVADNESEVRNYFLWKLQYKTHAFVHVQSLD